MGVGPNETFGYIWELTASDGPLEEDPQCLTQLYQSTVDPEKDLASGLVGTLLICKNEAIDQRGRLVRRTSECLYKNPSKHCSICANAAALSDLLHAGGARQRLESGVCCF